MTERPSGDLKKELMANDSLLGAQDPKIDQAQIELQSTPKNSSINREIEDDQDEDQNIQNQEIRIDNEQQEEASLPRGTHNQDSALEENSKLQKQPQPLISNNARRILMITVDFIGIVGLFIYTLYMQTYLSNFYLLMVLLIINFMFQKIPRGIGMFVNSNQQEKVVLKIDQFTKDFDQIRLNQQDQGVINIGRQISFNMNYFEPKGKVDTYAPKYWIVFTDISKVFWIMIFIVSFAFLIFKIVIYSLFSTKPEDVLNLMSQDNYHGLEIYYTLNSDDQSVTVSRKDYAKSFGPNSFVIIISILALLITRVEKKVPLELYNYSINSKSFKFYIVMIWLWLVGLIVCAQSIQGIFLLIFQLALTFKIFYNRPSPNKLEIFIVQSLKIYIYVIITVSFFFATQTSNGQGLEIFSTLVVEILDFLGLLIFFQLKQNPQTIVFIVFSFMLFFFLSLLSEQMNYQFIRVQLSKAIADSVEHFEKYKRMKKMFGTQKRPEIKDEEDEEEIQEDDFENKEAEDDDEESKEDNHQNKEILNYYDQQQVEILSDGPHSEQQLQDSDPQDHDIDIRDVNDDDETQKAQFYTRFNNYISQVAEKCRKALDNPVMTIRFLQITAIFIIILQRTYFSITLIVWSFIIGFTMNLNLCYYTSLILAIPSTFINLITYQYANIFFSNFEPNNPFLFWVDFQQYADNAFNYYFYLDYWGFDGHQILNFIQGSHNLAPLNIFFMSITLSAFVLLLKQIEEHDVQNNLNVQRKTEGLKFLSKKEKALDKISLWTLFQALLFKLSYVFSLFTLFWVSFDTINLMQFILVIFLLIFLINDSVQCEYVVSSVKKQPNDNHQEKQNVVLVPFSFKYWVYLVITVDVIVAAKYIFAIFYSSDTNNQKLIFQIIGLSDNQTSTSQQTRQEIIYWILFYFVTIQYDAYRSKIYLKYSNRLLECFMARKSMKKMFPDYQKKMGIGYLIYLKSIIWITFAVNLCLILFNSFSVINTILLLAVGILFCYYANSNINYKRMLIFWHFYLYLLVLVFIVRYFVQFICIPQKIIDYPPFLAWIYNDLQYNFVAYGFYYYDTGRLRWEYLSDVVPIFFGALSLNTFQTFAMSQDLSNIEEMREKFKQQDQGSRISSSQISVDSSLEGENAPDSLLAQKQLEEKKMIARLMKIQLIDEFSYLKTPSIIFANVNTDIITIYVVLLAMFVQQSITMLILMSIYLRYFLLVYNKILSQLQQNQIIKSLAFKIKVISKQYNLQIPKERQSQAETYIQDIDETKKIVDEIRITRMQTRIEVKQRLWYYSFYFAAFCILLTYLSQLLTSSLLAPQSKITATSPWSILIQTFYVFGTYAIETVNYTNSTPPCFCNVPAPSPTNDTCGEWVAFPTNIFSKIWFYLLLVFVNVVDSVCTEILIQEYKKSKHQMTESQRIGQKTSQVLEQQKYTLQIQPNQAKEFQMDKSHTLKAIQEEEEEEKLGDDQIVISEEDQTYKVTILNDMNIEEDFLDSQGEKIKSRIELEDNAGHALKNEARRYALILNFYKSQKIMLDITFSQGLFKILQRIFILVFLMNTMLVNNVFSFFYLGVATYLFMQKTSINVVKFLNSSSVFAICCQYLLLLLNFQVYEQLLPANFKNDNVTVTLSVMDFIGMGNHPAELSYLGFSTGSIEPNITTNSSLFASLPIQTNINLYWVIILNTLVLSLIYSYFIILEYMCDNVLKQTINLDKQTNITEQYVLIQLKNSEKSIFINFKAWKGAFYETRQKVYDMCVRNGHLIIMCIVLLIAQSGKGILDLIETLLAIAFFGMTEFYLKWPYQKQNKELMIKFYKILFWIPVISIFLFTFLKYPYILGECLKIDNTESDATADSFFCYQIFQQQSIAGMVFIMFFISLYFDLVLSEDYEQGIVKYQRIAPLRARIISKCLAYHANYKKFREIVYVEEQKNMFKKIQVQIMEKLKLWHRKMRQLQSEKVEDASPEKKTIDELEEQEVNEQIKLTGMQSFWVESIKSLQERNDFLKFMGTENMIDYILLENKHLNKHLYIPVEDYLRGDTKYYKYILDILDLFYKQIYKAIQEKKVVNQKFVDNLINDFLKENLNLTQSQMQQVQGSNYMFEIKTPSNIKETFQNGSKKELQYVHIYDPRLIILNTKTTHEHENLAQCTSTQLIVIFLEECGHLILSQWDTCIVIFILFYFCKNSGLLGAILPLLLFVWVLIEEGDPSSLFWMISYTVYTITVFIIFIIAIWNKYLLFLEKNLVTTIQLSEKTFWWYPLYDSCTDTHYSCSYNTTLEIFIMLMIIIQIFLQKRWGIYYQTINQVENIFKGYIRLKINKFKKQVKEELETEQEKKYEESYPMSRTSSMSAQTPIRIQDTFQQSVALKQEEQPLPQTKQQQQLSVNEVLDEQIMEFDLLDLKNLQSKKGKNRFETQLAMEPNLLKLNAESNFFERTFSQKFVKPGTDLYAITVFIQLFLFIFLFFCYSSMTYDGSGFNNIIKYNQVIPASLVLALLGQIIVMVIERYICLFNSTLSQKEELEQIQENNKEKTLNPRDNQSVFGKIFSILGNPEQTKQKSQQDFKQKYKVQFILKYILQVFLVIFIYWFIFIHLAKPYGSNSIDSSSSISANVSSVPYVMNKYMITFFLLYCLYFYVSALQLKYGFREIKMRNTFFEHYSMLSYSYGKTFYNIPFLFELKVLMDWTFLPTSLDIWQWFKLEDIHGLLFFAKIQSQGYIDRPVGERVVKIQKGTLGCCLVFGILLCIFGPLLLFSTLNPSNTLNLVNGGEFDIHLVNTYTGLSGINILQIFQVPIYSSNQLYGLSEELTSTQISQTINYTISNKVLLDAPQYGALQQFQLASYSNNYWVLSPPLFQLLQNQLNETINNYTNTTNTFFFNVTYYFTKQHQVGLSTNNYFQYPQNTILIDKSPYQNQTQLSLQTLTEIYNSMTTCNGNAVELFDFYIETLQIYSPDGKTFKPRPITIGAPPPQPVNMLLNCTQGVNSQNFYWNFNYAGNSYLLNSSNTVQGMIFFLTSNFESPLTSGFSIITIYTSVVLLIGTFIRSFFSGQVWMIEFTEMVTPDDLLMICQAISIARSQKDFVKENLLYYELIDILRSPEIVKIMTGSWTEVQKKKYIDQRVEEERKKLKQD